MKKKFVSIFMCVVVCSLSVIVPYYNVKATESVLAIGGLSVGSALLGTLALCGVGMELENNRQFNNLTDDEKERITNGLATNFNDVALQRGAGIETIKNWTDNLCQGILDKGSECWAIFKDWAKNISLTDISSGNIADNYPVGDIPINIGLPYNLSEYNATITQDMLTQYGFRLDDKNCDLVAYSYGRDTAYQYYFYIWQVNKDLLGNVTYTRYKFYGNANGITSYKGGVQSSHTVDYFNPAYLGGTRGMVCYGNNNINIKYNGEMYNANNFGQDNTSTSVEYFKTNTEYLERLQGEREGIIIDVTDIKNPIIEGQRNELTRIDFNRGSKRNNDDDDNKNELVFTPVTYEALDDYMIGQNNAITQYDNEITENPDDVDKIFISPSPIVNINEFYNTLPVVDIPVTNTVINNNYTYNNYTNNNVTLNDLPYNADLIPNIPTMIFENKFPFCIPYDMYTFLKVFYVEREAPTFTFDVPFPSENGLEVTQITLSLADFEYASLVLRVMWFLLFVFGLMLITRNLIKG